MMMRTLMAAAFLSLVFGGSPLASEGNGLRLSLPIDCVLGKSCWIPNYVDLIPGKELMDYNCGKATYNAEPGGQHKGTDFALRDMRALDEDIAVMAAAPGIVIGQRDGMKDVNFKKEGRMAVRKRECGNAVRIKHDNGLITQYCHMRRNSIAVRKGELVKRGQKLGLVGLSGMTEFPHLHFQVEVNKKPVDPFVGLDRKAKCGPGESPLWDEAALTALPYQPASIYNAGFAPKVPKFEEALEGLYRDMKIPPNTQVLALWGVIFNVRKGDELNFTITSPKGETLIEHKIPIKKDQARRYVYVGKKRNKSMWPLGAYRGEIKLIREEGKHFETSVIREIKIGR